MLDRSLKLYITTSDSRFDLQGMSVCARCMTITDGASTVVRLSTPDPLEFPVRLKSTVLIRSASPQNDIYQTLAGT